MKSLTQNIFLFLIQVSLCFGEIEIIENDIKSLAVLENLMQNYEMIEDRLTKVESENEQIRKENMVLRSKINELDDKIKFLENKVKNLEIIFYICSNAKQITG